MSDHDASADADRATQAPPQAPTGLGHPVSIPSALAALKNSMASDPDYSWGWFCNIAVPIMDVTGCGHAKANQAAAFLMFHLFNCDMTAHPLYGYGKPDAQKHAEFRLSLDQEEDAEIAAQAIEAGTAETGTGSVHESAVTQ